MKCLSTTLIKTTIGATISTVILSSSLALAQGSTSAASQTEAQEKDLQILQLQKEIEALKMQSASRASADEQTDKQATKNLTKAQKYAQKQEKKQAKIQAKQTRRNLSKNNFFLGLEVGGLQSQMQEKVDGTQNPTKKASGLNYGLMLGGSHFFGKYVGLRYYGDINISHSKFPTNPAQTIWARHGIGLDILANLIATQKNEKSYRFGVFAGLYTGLLNLSGTPSKDFGIGNVNLALNAGLRVDMGRFGFEFAGQLPFIKSVHSAVVFDNFFGVNQDGFSISANAKRQQNYTLNARLIVRF